MVQWQHHKPGVDSMLCVSLVFVSSKRGGFSSFSTGTFHMVIKKKEKLLKALQSHFAVIVWRKPDWSILNWMWCSETAGTTLYWGPEASPRPRIGCEILLFPPLEAEIAFFLRALGAGKGRTKKQNVIQSRKERLSHGAQVSVVRPFESIFGMSCLCLRATVMSGKWSLVHFYFFFFLRPTPFLCLSLYQGHNCEIPINACISFPCANGGTCHIQPGLEEHFRYDQNRQ